MEEELAQLIESNAWHELFQVRTVHSCVTLALMNPFQDINRDSSCMAQDYERIEASRPENKGLNRYRDVYPYDHSRVLLENHDATDYINASLVQVIHNYSMFLNVICCDIGKGNGNDTVFSSQQAPQAKRKYILTQGNGFTWSLLTDVFVSYYLSL